MTMTTTGARPRAGWVQGVVAAAAAIRSRHVGRRLNAANGLAAAQRRIWGELVAQFGRTEFGRTEGIGAGMTYADFRTRVRPRMYADLAPAIERMKQGEPSVLWPGRCSHFAVSSGTTAGRTKYLPITRPMLAHFRRAGLDSLCYYARRAGSTAVFRGRQLFLGGSTALVPLPATGPFRAWAGDLSGITALNLPAWAERCWYEPGRRIAQIGDWPDKLRAMAERTRTRDVRLLAGIPSWILVFAETMRLHSGERTLKDVWPNLGCFVHGGVPIGPFAGELREALGPGVDFHEVYPASEAFIAAQDEEPEAGLRLIHDAGVFFEFLPMDRFDESRLADLAAEVVPAWEVVAGVDYALLLTTPGGLCRYVIGDVVRFVSTDPARLVYAGRTQLQLSAFGEHVIEKEVTDALTAVCARRRVAIANFHVAPRFVDARAGINRGQHEWWIELRTSDAARLSPTDAAAELDGELQRLNDDYEAKRKGGGLNRPLVHVVPSGTFELWLKAHGKWGGQHKMPRCRSDRAVADELAGCLLAR